MPNNRQHAELIDYMGSDLAVVNAARVSFANQDDEGRTEEQNVKLIKYLAKHNHFTPFCHTSITLRMVAPIPIRTQCFKHKFGFVENEESRRYVSYTPEYFVPKFRKAADNKKQGSGGEFGTPQQYVLDEAYRAHMDKAIQNYERMLAEGVCEEQARFLLPQGCMVNWYWTGSLAAFARFYGLRSKPESQLEIQQLAEQVSEIIKPLFPISWAALTGE